MAYVIGANCDVILNNNLGFYIKQGSYRREKKRIHRTRVTKNGIMHYIDTGPLFNQFNFTIIIGKNWINIDGSANTDDPVTMRGNLWSLYQQSNFVFPLFTPNNEYFTVMFTDLKERVADQAAYYSDGSNTLKIAQYEWDCEFLEV